MDYKYKKEKWQFLIRLYLNHEWMRRFEISKWDVHVPLWHGATLLFGFFKSEYKLGTYMTVRSYF